jgi:hypothetical protein
MIAILETAKVYEAIERNLLTITAAIMAYEEEGVSKWDAYFTLEAELRGMCPLKDEALNWVHSNILHESAVLAKNKAAVEYQLFCESHPYWAMVYNEGQRDRNAELARREFKLVK